MVKKTSLEKLAEHPKMLHLIPTGVARSQTLAGALPRRQMEVSCRMSYEEEARGLLGSHDCAQKWDLDMQTERALETQRR